MSQKHERAMWIRGQLVARRKDLGLSLRKAANLISAEMSDGETITHQALVKWEQFEAQPRIDQIAAWCRGLGLRLRVLVVDPSAERVATTIPTAIVPLVGAMERMSPRDLALVQDLVNRLSTPDSENLSTLG